MLCLFILARPIFAYIIIRHSYDVLCLYAGGTPFARLVWQFQRVYIPNILDVDDFSGFCRVDTLEALVLQRNLVSFVLCAECVGRNLSACFGCKGDGALFVPLATPLFWFEMTVAL